MRWFWRTLGFFLGLIVIIMITLLLVGQRSSAGYAGGTVEIARPPAQVWRYLTEDDLLKRWVGSLIGLEHMDAGGFGVNSKIALGEERVGALTNVEMTINAVAPAQHMAFTIDSIGDRGSGFTEQGEYWLTPIQGGAGTRLTLATTSRYHGFLPTILEPIISHEANTKAAQDLARLKGLVETEPAIR